MTGRDGDIGYEDAAEKIRTYFKTQECDPVDFNPIMPRGVLKHDLEAKFKAGEKLISLTTLDLKAYSANFPNQLKDEGNENDEDLTYGNKDGIANIPFIKKNADTTLFKSEFWIEEMQREDGTTYMQLQYAQKINLIFPVDYGNHSFDGGIAVWPHINVNTLIKV